MRKSVIEPANALTEKLFEIPEMVTAFHQRKSGIAQHWVKWLEEVEALLKSFNLPQCAEIAGYRAAVLSSAQTNLDSRTGKRKRFQEAALKSVQPVQQILSDISDELNAKLEQVRSLIKQILIPAKDAGIIQYDAKTDFTTFIESLLIQLKSHEQLRPSINNAISLIGKYDVFRILAEEIEL